MKNTISIIALLSISLTALAASEAQPENTLFRNYCGITVNVSDVDEALHGVSATEIRQSFQMEHATKLTECYIDELNMYAMVASFESKSVAILLRATEYLVEKYRF